MSPIRDEFEPTAASELSPAKRPTTMMSAALKSSCRMLVSITGMAKSSILGIMRPLHMLMVYLRRLFLFW